MKGLLIKDFRLLMAQKRFFLMVAVIAVIMSVMNNDVSFLLGFVTLIISQFAVSTVSYDEFDNGYPFLFTLPVSRRGYAVEKYVFGLLLGFTAWAFAMALSLIVTAAQGGALLTVLLTGVSILPAALLMQSITLPFQLKFGGEKGRLALMAMAGVIFVVIAGGSMLLDSFGADANALTADLAANGALVLAGTYLLALLIWAASMAVSIRIMEKKEF